MRQLFTSAQLPAYHSGMLIVRIRPTMGPAAAVAAAPRGAPSVLGTRGMSALSMFERGGLIRRVVSLARRPTGSTAVVGARRAMSVLVASVEPSPGGTLNAGVNLLELERDADATELQVALAGDPTVEFVSRVPVRYLLARPRPRTRGRRGAAGATIAAIPPPAVTMWNLAKIRWAEARATAGYQEPTTIRVAVLDTGIDRAHPDLVGRVTSYTHQHPDIPAASGERDIIGHGTHVAGTIGAIIGNEVGINGICQCELHIWKIFDDVADFDTFSQSFVYFVDPVMYLRALADCVEQRVDVVNLSIGGGGQPDHQEQLLFDTLIANGTTVVAAMGNERQFGSPTSFPAAIPGVIAVGATKLDDAVANFSNRGNHIALSAPGVAIWSTLPTQPGQFGFEAIIGPDGQPREGKAERRETDYSVSSRRSRPPRCQRSESSCEPAAEAQRIKNWNTRTAHSGKRIVSPYAIVFTGTPGRVKAKVPLLWEARDVASEFAGRSAPLSSDGFAEATERLRVTAAAVWAILRVETIGCGFLPDRRPKILFERHLFHQATGGRFSQSHPGISHPTAGGYGPGGSPQYDRLAEALALERGAALRATSWGLGQVLGLNFRAAGFADVETMVAAMRDSEDRQLAAMAGFILANRLDAVLRAQNWTDFARRYNGPDYARNQYDTRLAAEYGKLAAGPLPDLTVREAQVYLTYLGHDPGPVDGVMGRRTRSALGDFARHEGLGDLDDLLPELLARLRAGAHVKMPGERALRRATSARSVSRRPARRR